MFACLTEAFKAREHDRRLRREHDPPELKLVGRRRARLLETHDGDTMKVSIVRGGKVVKVTVRVMGVDTPEVRSKNAAEKAAGLRARNFVASWAMPGVLSVDGEYTEADLKRAYADTPVLLDVDFHGGDKYGRELASIYRPGCSSSLNDVLITSGHAVAYAGGTKPTFSAA